MWIRSPELRYFPCTTLLPRPLCKQFYCTFLFVHFFRDKHFPVLRNNSSSPRHARLQQEKRKRPDEMVQKERVEGRGGFGRGRSRSRSRGYSGYAARRSRSPPRRRSRSSSRYVWWWGAFHFPFTCSTGILYAYPPPPEDLFDSSLRKTPMLHAVFLCGKVKLLLNTSKSPCACSVGRERVLFLVKSWRNDFFPHPPFFCSILSRLSCCLPSLCLFSCPYWGHRNTAQVPSPQAGAELLQGPRAPPLKVPLPEPLPQLQPRRRQKQGTVLAQPLTPPRAVSLPERPPEVQRRGRGG